MPSTKINLTNIFYLRRKWLRKFLFETPPISRTKYLFNRISPILPVTFTFHYLRRVHPTNTFKLSPPESKLMAIRTVPVALTALDTSKSGGRRNKIKKQAIKAHPVGGICKRTKINMLDLMNWAASISFRIGWRDFS